MCVILHRLAGKEVAVSDLRSAYDHNPDGCGLMFLEDGKLVIQKGLWQVDEMLEKVAALGDREYCLHLRIKTHGKVNEENCHPFSIWSSVAMMHNGILSIKCPDADKSDTWHFAKCLREFRVGPWIHEKENLEAIEEFHGSFNRMCFMSPAGVERTGSWEEHEGNWWSNLNWQPVTGRGCYPRGYFYDSLDGDDYVGSKWGKAWGGADDQADTVTVAESDLAHVDCIECGERVPFHWGDFAEQCPTCTTWLELGYPSADSVVVVGVIEDDSGESKDLICLPEQDPGLWERDDDEFVCGRDRLL